MFPKDTLNSYHSIFLMRLMLIYFDLLFVFAIFTYTYILDIKYIAPTFVEYYTIKLE